MDVVGHIQESNKGYRYILEISDYASRYVFTIPIKNQTAPTKARCLVNNTYHKIKYSPSRSNRQRNQFLISISERILCTFQNTAN